jgi:hypothetical protein
MLDGANGPGGFSEQLYFCSRQDAKEEKLIEDKIGR